MDDMYDQFAKKERKKAFDDIAALFESVCHREKSMRRYRKLLANIEGDLVAPKDGDVICSVQTVDISVFGKHLMSGM